MKQWSILVIALLFSGFVSAQSYNTAFGMRLGTDWGLTVKQRVSKLTTLEAIVQSSLQREEAMVTLLAEQHFPMITRRLNVYAGAGLHKGWIDGGDDETGAEYDDPFGLSLIGGAEMSLGRFNISYDFKPAINLTGGEKTFYTQTAVSLRYVIVKRPWLKGDPKKKRKRQRERERRKRDKDEDWWKFWENW